MIPATSPPPVRTDGTDDAIVELDGVEKSYREGATIHAVLRGASARIGEGEFVALLGPSGSGKSTLLNLVSGIDTPDAGRIRVGDAYLDGMTERERTLFRRRHVGFVFQFYNLLPTLTVEENLLLPLELAGQDGPEDVDRARSLLAAVGLGDRRDSFPDRLSGGEQQRVALVRALVHRPSLVLADEPTGNLDRETGDRVLDLLVDLVRDEGTTLVMVTHARSQAARADRVLHLDRGVLVEASVGDSAEDAQTGRDAEPEDP